MRTEIATEAQRTREASAADFAALRTEVTRNIAELSRLLQTGLNGFRADNKRSDDLLRNAVQRQMDAITQRLTSFTSETNQQHINLREALNNKLNELMESNTALQNQLRTAVEDRLTKLNDDNSKELEKMRQTVDEKLNDTLQTRLTECFGQVTDQLNKVHTGLGEMTKLSDGVNDLSRIFTNVKSRGGFAEVQLGMLLEQMLAPSQFIRNAKVKEGSLEAVEFAVRFPGHSGETLLPIDAKFPREDWERLEAAYESNIPEQIATAGKAFESAIRTEGDRICSKYINPPAPRLTPSCFSPPKAFTPRSMRRDATPGGDSVQVPRHHRRAKHALRHSDQLPDGIPHACDPGKRRRGMERSRRHKEGVRQLRAPDDQRWKTQVGTVQNTIQKLGVRTRAINNDLREVGEPDKPASLLSNLIDFDQAAGITPSSPPPAKRIDITAFPPHAVAAFALHSPRPSVCLRMAVGASAHKIQI